MSRNPDKTKNFLIIFFASLTIISLSAAGGFYFVQKSEIDKENQVNQLYINKFLASAASDLANSDNCLATLKGRSLTKSSFDKLDIDGKSKFPINSLLEDSQVKIMSYSIETTPAELAKSFSSIQVRFHSPIGNKDYSEKIRLYVEADQYDRLTFCNALSSTFAKDTSSFSKSILRVKHVKAKGILAKFDENKTSVAAATCPEGYLMTGCNGSTNECPFEAVAPFKIEPQALNPNTCEVWIKATEKCEVFALATAICSKIITQ